MEITVDQLNLLIAGKSDVGKIVQSDLAEFNGGVTCTFVVETNDGEFFKFEYDESFSEYHEIDDFYTFPLVGKKVFQKQVTTTIYCDQQ